MCAKRGASGDYPRVATAGAKHFDIPHQCPRHHALGTAEPMALRAWKRPVLQRLRLQLGRWCVICQQPPVIATPAIGFPRHLVPLRSMGNTDPLGFTAFRATPFTRHSRGRSKEFAAIIFGMISIADQRASRIVGRSRQRVPADLLFSYRK